MKAKVLTIKEPYVTPIALGKKHYETRSWKTNYRGPIYIHTAKTVMPDPVNGCERIFPLGSIVLKANLTDCIKMDEEFIAKIKQDPDEYAFGFYEPGRFAWKLEDVEILVIPVAVKGKLGIWEVEI